MSASETRSDASPKRWLGRCLEDFAVGDVLRSRLERTISEIDSTRFACPAVNTNQVQFNQAFAEPTWFGRLRVNSCLTLALVTGLSVPDTSENAPANLARTDIKLPNPVFVGDTLFSESEVTGLRGSASDPDAVIEHRRTFMPSRRGSAAVLDAFPRISADSTV